MSSTNRVDYSVRQNKTIERSIIFDGLRKIYDAIRTILPPVYVGFGSVWFTDFHLAHRLLDVTNMISMELDEITAKRAEFNKPYRTIEVIHGDSINIVPELLERNELKDVPWIAWLDFDKALDEDRIQQLDNLVRYLPRNSTLITTFSATRGQYGNPGDRVERLAELFDFATPEQLQARDVREEDGLARVLAQSLESRLVSLSTETGRPRAVPVFALRYKDGTPMVTTGVFLPDSSTAQTAHDLVMTDAWPGIIDEPITTPPLTTREVSAIRAMLPTIDAITRSRIQEMGFDLEDDQLSAFTAHYNRYPTFAQLAF
jgi:hypothetical protein